MSKFKYTYSAPTEQERKEIESIKNQYSKSPNQNKLDRLRHLDKKVKNIPMVISLLLGIVGTLIFGLGLSMVLEFNLLAWGVIVSLVGLIPTISAYFAYNKIFSYLKEKHSQEILELSDDLLNNQNTNQI